ncbi:hypothetical protein, partial [Croceibacter atlanticus]|uniref:hypothetical protein n=1 Tax=Croceibacter atlanticus TaxID=313588 RepID=UPI0030DADFC8
MQEKNNGIIDFLNADPKQKAFGVETQIKNLMTQYEMAVRNNDKDLASMLNKEINDLEAIKIKIMADATEIPKLANGMNQFGMISLMKSMEDKNKGMLEEILDIFDKDAQDEAEEDLNKFNSSNEDDDLFYDFEKDGGVAIDIDGKSPSEIGEDIATMGEPSFMERLAGLSDSPKNKMLTKGQMIRPSSFRAPQVIKLNGGGLANLGINFDINDYLKTVLGIDVDNATEEDMATALARAYGAPSEGIGAFAGSMGYQGTKPGQEISIDAQDKTPAAYRFYPSEVSKIYAQAKGVPFSPLVAP